MSKKKDARLPVTARINVRILGSIHRFFIENGHECKSRSDLVDLIVITFYNSFKDRISEFNTMDEAITYMERTGLKWGGNDRLGKELANKLGNESLALESMEIDNPDDEALPKDEQVNYLAMIKEQMGVT